MSKVTKEDLVNFINRQPDDRPINFKENKSSDTCGCLMVHYAKSLGYDNFSCGIFTISSDDDYKSLLTLTRLASSIICENIHSDEIKTYKELKER